REGPGKCFRLYPESRFEGLDDSTIPEIKRCNLSKVILQLSALGVDDIIGFDLMEKPDRSNWTPNGTSSHRTKGFKGSNLSQSVWLLGRNVNCCINAISGIHLLCAP
nr:pre-mRNA-splicing factor ATP-dependent RNA helicase DEAH10 [Tanacetum cinerariifolium]